MTIPNFKELLKDKRYAFWLGLFVISITGIILMFCSTYISGSADRSHWKESFILYLYFTFMSNMFAVVTSAIVVWNKVKISSKHLQRLKVMMAVNLTITAIIFWVILRSKISSYGPLAMTCTIIVHTVTPTIALFVFFYESFKTRVPDEGQISPIKSMIINTSFPLLWFVMAVVVYLSLGMDKEAAIYGFLDFKGNWHMSLTVIPILMVAYPGLTFLYSWIYNK